MLQPNEILEQIISEKEPSIPEEPITKEEPLEPDAHGIGIIRFLCTKKLSNKITGNNIDGDDRIVWDRKYLDQIKEAREKFYKLIDEGCQAYMIRKDGKKSRRRMHKFNPNAEEILMIPLVAGG